MKKRHGLGKSEKIRKSFEFKKAREKGTIYHNGAFSLTIANNGMGYHRLGLSIGSRKIPLASSRNRIRRLIKEVFRINRPDLKGGPYDIVISIRRPPDYKADYSAVEKNLLMLLKKAKAL